MKNLFNKVKLFRPKTSIFDLTHDVKMSGLIGRLMPILAVDVLPGDRVKIGQQSEIRFAPLLAPIQHRVDVFIEYYYVRNSTLWDGWEPFITQDPDDVRAAPYWNVDNTVTDEAKKFMDYFGIPPHPGTSGRHLNINALPFAAYAKIWNDYFRDENLQDKLDWETLIDGQNTIPEFIQTQNVAWEQDYFTSALPWAQKGTAVTIPMGDITLKDAWYDNPDVGIPKFSRGGSALTGDITQVTGAHIDVGGTEPTAYNPANSLLVTGGTITDLARARKLEEFFQHKAIGGTRYNEFVKAIFGHQIPDATLQRPEYITGIKSPVMISEVLNTNGKFQTYDGTTTTETGSAQGDMAGHGIALPSNPGNWYTCQDYGWIIGVLYVRPKPAYQNGVEKMFRKLDAMDYFIPQFSNLGEQEIQNSEIFAWGANPDDTFGYQSRYAEYKFKNSRIAGDYRTTLNFWHMGRIFSEQQNLNSAFIQCDNSEVNRVFATENTGDDHLWMHVLNTVVTRRPMPYFGTPHM